MGRKILLNRKILPESEAKVSVYDSSLMFGDTVFEMLRTFNRKTFKLDDHIDRLYASAQYTSIDMPYMKDELIQAHENLLIENRNDIEGEFRSLINVSRGTLPMYKDIVPCGTWVMMTCFPLEWIIPDAFKLYSEGINVVIPNQRQISPQGLCNKGSW